jgi:hypothetical protein
MKVRYKFELEMAASAEQHGELLAFRLGMVAARMQAVAEDMLMALPNALVTGGSDWKCVVIVEEVRE